MRVTQEIDRARAQCNITNITKTIWCGVCSCIVFYGVHVSLVPLYFNIIKEVLLYKYTIVQGIHPTTASHGPTTASPHMYTVLMRRLSLFIDPYMTNSNEIESSLSTVLLYICPHGRCPITVHQHYMEDLCHVLLIPNMYFYWYAPTRTYSILIRS